MIRFPCPTCGKHLKAPDQGAGQTVSCPRCSQRLLVPSPGRVSRLSWSLAEPRQYGRYVANQVLPDILVVAQTPARDRPPRPSTGARKSLYPLIGKTS
jgi:DNA-directed RNA polymerase subunit RPC12/RpoP